MYSLKPGASDSDSEAGEVLNTTPGSIYSSAILFPMKREPNVGLVSEQPTVDAEQSGASVDDVSDMEYSELDEITDISSSDDEDLNSLSRRFPSSIGISCCLDSEFARDNDLKIVISGRYYSKIQDKTRIEVIVENPEEFGEFLKHNASLLNEWFLLSGDKLSLRQVIPATHLTSLKDSLRTLNIQIANQIAQNSDDTLDPIFNAPDFKEQYRFLSSYKERLFKRLSSLKADGSYITDSEAEAIKGRIRKIEKNETFISYVEDLVAACDSRNFGFWVEYPFEKELDLKSLDLHIIQYPAGKIAFSPREHECLKDIIAVDINEEEKLSLSVWLQLIKSKDGRTYIKVLLNNTSTKVATDEQHYYSIVSERVNVKSFFGIKIEASSKHICPYKDWQLGNLEDEEAHILNFLYRKIEDYGVGHFCSVDWKKDESGVMRVFSEFMPSFETPDVEPVPRDKTKESIEGDVILPKPYLEDSQCLQFKWLSIFSETSNEDIIKGLTAFASSYRTWIEAQRNSINFLEEKEIATQNVDTCEADCKRMESNIQEFLSDPTKMKVFRIMNAAMFMQLWHNKKENQKIVREEEPKLNFDFYKYAGDDIFPGADHAAWRPFQLAFILLNLDGIFKSENDAGWSKRNDLVDLVWFPTGGGKTEAYLGLIALTIINRRMTKGEEGYGVTAIMRYTLRLLTTQQFQRALRLILALEQLRIWDLDDCELGEEQISIGLFVGAASLPNHLDGDDGLIAETRKWKDRTGDNNMSKIPLDTCPWCGSKLQHISNRSEVTFFCSNPCCSFDMYSAPLPVRLCDDDIYKNPPTLLFGTVDKFAQLAHKASPNRNEKSKDSRRVFGRGHEWTKLTPDLIIQDELHLLLGPLGSAVSLYECTIDRLCSRTEDGITVRPKIISSTATTRNTALQVRALYDRRISIFPKNGLDYDDSFFAFYKRNKHSDDEDWTYTSKRKYIGIMPTGRTQMTTQMRLAGILFVHRAIFEKENLSKLHDKDFIKAADYYFTTISYFNSLKEVGKTDAQFYMEFTKYTRRLFKRVLRYSDMLECLYAYNERFSKSELTGRLSGNEAVAALNNVQSVSWDPHRRFPFKDGENWYRSIKPDDYILATNMISVGLDVSRFNTIIMNSMPRNIAEYIQASSRVARDKEGLVLTLHNPFRSRDVSHFEKFREFHEKLYYFVEPISITPFSHKTVEKYLPLFLGAYVRHLYPNLAANQSATNMDEDLVASIEEDVKEYFKDRLGRTETLPGLERELLTSQMVEYIASMTHELFMQWLDKKENSERLVYVKPKDTRNQTHRPMPLYSSSDDYDDILQQHRWNVPMALRLLEPEAVIHIKK